MLSERASSVIASGEEERCFSVPGLKLWSVLCLGALILCATVVVQVEGRQRSTAAGVVGRRAGAGETLSVHAPVPEQRPGAVGAAQFQRIEEKRGEICAEYGCRNFNNDSLRAGLTISTRELVRYLQGYGYFPSELESLTQWQKKALDEAYRYAVQNRQSQQDLNRAGAAIKAEYRAKYRSFLTSRGFTILPGNTLSADLPGIAGRNVKELRPMAQALGAIAEKNGYDSSEVIGAALSLVQTAFRYEAVPMVIDGRQTGGIYPPLEAVAKGKGDCDTKSVLLAALLMNWNKVKLVGIGVPDHYLMGVLRNPGKGDAYVEYQGLRYVLMEPSGPAWLPPGMVGPTTTALLNSGAGMAVEPFTN
ncbi:hypothetical protein GMLC_13250 [Geomonas limicola]|uniref:Transglutaminase-like domain-containing protein n=1 Tax=Geomonas limicola TaxID=2740186 RepID=A0A6V8N5E0_9BACT|nr:hypothetical protein [Geomonas limicola]GFO67746.1 hypothetical protein GMLC_13250 [Geomonas limicola]